MTTVVVGAGHSGLAMSAKLRALGIDHVLLERGEAGGAWRRERWDSLRLLTPNWQTALPGHAYSGADPDGFMSAGEVADFITDYAARIEAPVHTGAEVLSVRLAHGDYRIATSAGPWRCRSLVVASGACNLPALPKVHEALPDGVESVHSLGYRRPDDLPDGGVLVVGASATGLQIGEEIHRSGRPVTLCVGEHVRMPRHYRERDIFWWMHRIGRLDERYDEVADLPRARSLPSPQLVGTAGHDTLDLNALTRQGVRMVGRLMGFRGGAAQFSGSLRNVCTLADLKLNRLLGSIDEWAAEHGGAEVEAGWRPPKTVVPDDPPLTLDLGREGIRSVIWATGYRPDYSWLEVPVFDRKGRIRHDGGIVLDAPGMVVAGLPFLRRRKSSFIHGAEDDAEDLAAHIAAHLDVDTPAARDAANGAAHQSS